ncbi:hypothetical protein EDD15DRAFT_2198412 [Pisolithus albus]|nr:hypothetical protein EDD15DRAFT_2198412 [Pisolithus albus]
MKENLREAIEAVHKKPTHAPDAAKCPADAHDLHTKMGTTYVAALSSPIKAGVQLTSKGIVKIKDVVTIKQEDRNIKVPSNGTNWTNNDIPQHVKDSNCWHGVMVPTYCSWIGACPDPWKRCKQLGITSMRINVPHTIKVTGAIYHVMNQCVCEYRTNFGSTTLMILSAFFAGTDELKTQQECQEFAVQMLQNCTFVYQDSTMQLGPLQVSTHCPDLRITFHEDTKCSNCQEFGSDGNMQPRAALALATAAVEHALKLYSTGQTHKKGRTLLSLPSENAFSIDKWGTAMKAYMVSICKLRDSEFADIVKAVQPYMKMMKRAYKTTDKEELDDEHACLEDDESVDSEHGGKVNSRDSGDDYGMSESILANHCSIHVFWLKMN